MLGFEKHQKKQLLFKTVFRSEYWSKQKIKTDFGKFHYFPKHWEQNWHINMWVTRRLILINIVDWVLVWYYKEPAAGADFFFEAIIYWCIKPTQ